MVSRSPGAEEGTGRPYHRVCRSEISNAGINSNRAIESAHKGSKPGQPEIPRPGCRGEHYICQRTHAVKHRDAAENGRKPNRGRSRPYTRQKPDRSSLFREVCRYAEGDIKTKEDHPGYRRER